MADVIFTRTSQTGGSDVPATVYSKSFTLTGSSWSRVSESMEIGTNVAVTLAIDVSACKFFRIHSTTAATIKTNSSGSPNDTINLLAGVAYDWQTTDYDPFLLGTDVTVIYVTNAAATVLTVEVLQDATP